MEIIHGNEQEFEMLIQDSLVLVDFFATWCGPCKMLGPVLEEIAKEQENLKIVKIDIDENPNLSKKFAIMSVPTLILFRNGEAISTQHGFMPKPLLENWIEKNR